MGVGVGYCFSRRQIDRGEFALFVIGIAGGAAQRRGKTGYPVDAVIGKVVLCWYRGSENG